MSGHVLYTAGRFLREHAESLDRIAAEHGTTIERIEVPVEGRLDPADVDRITLAFFSGDLVDAGPATRRFFGVARTAPALQWMQLGNAGTDDPIFTELMANGVRLTNSSGDAAAPIAQAAIGGMLMLSRGFLRWQQAQREHVWRRHAGEEIPPDLEGQCLVVLGPGAIGGRIARIARALGLHVIGVRRSPPGPEDVADEWHTPDRLLEISARADWLAIACPLNDQTRGMVSSEVLSAMPSGAHVLNVARGEVVDEEALIEALRNGRLGGAYLDVFHEEPLPPDSPIWDLPNVIVSPHDSSSARGNRSRSDARFLRNLERWLRGEPLEQELTQS